MWLLFVYFSSSAYSSFGLLMQAIRLKYLHPDGELQNYAIQVMDMLRADTSVDAYTLVFFNKFLGF